ncbi:MMPL family transporter [Nocardioides okcheonensis]|uniref:MMPL family transporter n=1 Tax=Nocardioides okcheonensis TaxID=2894081 RepID=UPI001E6193B1|nr:MMPL family transporter [Nocardioides okcheonensis]UFN45176.1 MMPL family transporter [Nocardioides okcheonensis]
MARLLYRLGRWSATHALRVVAAWLALLVAMIMLAVTAAGETTDDFSIPSTESFAALDRLGERFPGAEGASAQVVFVAPEQQRLDQPRVAAVVTKTLDELANGSQVVSVISPAEQGTVSRDGRTGYATVQYAIAADQISDASRTEARRAIDAARDAGLTVEVGGDALVPIDELGYVTELIGLAIAALVLVLTLGSLVAAGLPMLTALVGVGIGLAGVLGLSAMVSMSSTAPVLALMLGLAVGLDYALFILSRHRTQLAAGMPMIESVARATATAGSAVIFAGATVVVALAGLTLVNIPFLTVMGLAAAATVAIAVLVAITLVPATLGMLGGRIDRGKVRRRMPAAGSGLTWGGMWVRAVVRRPLMVAATCMLGLGVLTVPLASLQLGLPGNDSAPTDTTQRQAYDLVADSFGEGVNGPLVVLVEAPSAIGRTAKDLAAAISEFDGVAAVSPPLLDESREAALVQVVPATGPSDEATATLVDDIRTLARTAHSADPGVDVAVTGTTAVNIDITEKLAGSLPLFLSVVVGLALILLLVVFRSAVVPVQAALGFLLSLAATAGVVVAIFQWGWGANLLGVDQVGPIIHFLPVLLIGILFGLAMDYQVFLVSRMREEHVHGAGTHTAIVNGFVHSARVVTAAALIMIAVFLGFFFAHDPVVKCMGFALALGVAIDAFVVRMTLLPAVMTLMGHRTWWLPTWLERIVPDVDVEGARLDQLALDDPVPAELPATDAGDVVGTGLLNGVGR